MPFIQLHRHLSFGSPLGDDTLLLTQFRGEEGVSNLFRFDLELLSEDPAIDLTAIIGKNCTVRLRQVDGSDRFFNGVVSRFSQGGSTASLTTYHAELVPWLWLLSRTADCKIFQDMTIPQIVTAVFDTYGFSDYDLRLSGDYPVREYVVQYRETDFNFVSRLLEQYGIFYFFEHTNGVHTLVLADSNAEFKPCPNQTSARYQVTQAAVKHDEDVVTAWSREQEARSARYSLMDFNFKVPAINLQVNIDSVLPPPAGMSFEIYDYPGDYDVIDVGTTLASVRMEEEEAQTAVIQGAGNCRPFTTGTTFDLFDHPRDDFNATYVLLRLHHLATDRTHESGDAGGFTYANQFVALPAAISYRPPRITPRPVIQGLQTAVVAGPEEIYVDEFGRIKVQFHWDRIHQRDDESSCWIRVSQTWAGKGWGSVFTPRVGMEVLVAFLEGDPDQPVVVGAVFNGDQTQPYPLPDYKTRAVIRTDTTEGGGGCNQIYLEDKAGLEEIYIHGQRDLNIHTNYDRHETIEGERHLSVWKDKLEGVGQSRYAQIATDDVGTVGQDLTRSIGGNLVLKVGGGHSEDVADTIYLKAGTNVVIEAGTQITLNVSGNFITIGGAGITIQGTQVLINSGGAPGTATMAQPKTIPEIVGVDRPDIGSPDFNIFDPTNVDDPGNATGSEPVEPGEVDGED